MVGHCGPQYFSQFHAEHLGHTLFPASPITGDPTLLFTNSGMVQFSFKPLFLSRVEKGSSFEGLKKACNRCV